ncbi:hypothetical protein MTBPR1_110018 [Candidatus Terasakiella magnetica]|uniref:Uncharacterized protein n=1 Tax=Candidatus Terasakiella magnetica TaxID=1867952 RepID=A0A1C3RE82_9PROT|nr:hypothetical protein [Candidatus Terasakiella magnetica]SCA55579.1 hypothetical protein MTBPR1_110018 [Candidatus Terasakiella magnetica]
MIGPVSSSYSNVGQLYDPQRLSPSQNELVQSVLSGYNANALKQADIQEINDTFREAGIVPSADLKAAVEAAGFKAEDLRSKGGQRGGNPPPPPPPQEADSEETVDAFLDLLEQYQGQEMNANTLNEMTQKWTESGHTQNGSFISIMA